jgi:DNA-binding transcriptional ArsR family regulator
MPGRVNRDRRSHPQAIYAHIVISLCIEPYPSAEIDRAAELLRALGSPTRLAIVIALGSGPHCVHELVDLLGDSQPVVSQHLRVLRGTRIVRGTRRGKEVAYELLDDHIRHIAHDAIRHTKETP